jgi:CTP:molybdopterin cytidylyltransferase MocA
MSLNIATMILAAGESSRMRESEEIMVLKPLLPYRGTNVLGHLIENVEAARMQNITVVLGFQAETILSSIKEYPIHIVINRTYELGMLSSIQCGLKYLHTKLTPAPDACLICLGDQPGLKPETFKAMAELFNPRENSILIATHENRKGHPILIPACYLEEILAIPPEKGLRELMLKYSEAVKLIPLPDSWVTRDIDTPEDYQKALQEE